MHRYIFRPSLPSTLKFRKLSEKQASTYNTSTLPLRELGTRPAKYLLVNSAPLERNAGWTLIRERDAKNSTSYDGEHNVRGQEQKPITSPRRSLAKLHVVLNHRRGTARETRWKNSRRAWRRAFDSVRKIAARQMIPVSQKSGYLASVPRLPTFVSPACKRLVVHWQQYLSPQSPDPGDLYLSGRRDYAIQGVSISKLRPRKRGVILHEN